MLTPAPPPTFDLEKQHQLSNFDDVALVVVGGARWGECHSSRFPFCITGAELSNKKLIWILSQAHKLLQHLVSSPKGGCELTM